MEAEYYVEMETVEGGRTVVGSGGKHQSSVAGIKAVLEDKLKRLKGRVELLVFAQDTVLLNELVKDNSLRSMYFGSTGKSVKRMELLGRVLRALYSSNEKAARELDSSVGAPSLGEAAIAPLCPRTGNSSWRLRDSPARYQAICLLSSFPRPITSSPRQARGTPYYW